VAHAGDSGGFFQEVYMSGRFFTLSAAGCAICAAFALFLGCNNPTNACSSLADECVTNSQQGFCISDGAGAFTCAVACSGAMDSFTCGIGGACYYIADKKFACMGTYLGQKAAGQECKNPNDCQAGAQCVNYAKDGTATKCYIACTDHCTTVGSKCVDSGHSFNICTGLY
jgi:hypothetical protein